MDTYFSKFPIITYAADANNNSYACRDITERVKLYSTPRLTPQNYYPFAVPNNMRADILANEYYDDSTLDWLIYLPNNILDPYYDWHLSDTEFNNYLTSKYGSVAFAQQQIAYWRTNWPVDESNLTVSYYNNLPDIIRKYYIPMWGAENMIMGYSRRQQDWFASTNQIVNIGINMNNNTVFSNNDPLIISLDGINIGNMQVVTSNSTTLTAQHISGATIDLTEVNINTPSYLLLLLPASYNGPGMPQYIVTSLSNSSISGMIVNNSIITTNIPTNEAAFWEPVYYYDIENEKNANNRIIELLEKNYAPETTVAIQQALSS